MPPPTTGAAAPIVPPLAMIKRVAGERDQRARRNRALVDERDGPDRRVEQRVAHRHRRVDAAAEGVDVEQHGRGAGLARLANRARQERREAEIDRALDRR